jgi:hypothetical protein
VGRPVHEEPPAEVYGSPTMVMEDRAIGLPVESRPGNTWAENPRKSWSSPPSLLFFLSGIDGIFLPDGSTHELVEGPSLEGH